MPVSLLSYCTAFGLSAGAGSRAGLAGLALGLFHYTPYMLCIVYTVYFIFCDMYIICCVLCVNTC